MFNRKALIALITMTSFGLSQAMEIQKQSLSYPRGLGQISVIHAENGFNIQDSDGDHIVPSWQLSKELRGIPTPQLAKMLSAGAYLKINKQSDNQYSVDVNGRLKGGGPLFAAFAVHIGVVGTNILGHGILLAIAACTGPAAGPVYTGLAAAYAGPILATSKAVGLGLGIAASVTPTP